jgi:hypothetical protein
MQPLAMRWAERPAPTPQAHPVTDYVDWNGIFFTSG